MINIHKYNDTLIAIDTKGNLINATDMLKAYPGKKINDFLRLKSTKEYIKVLERETGIPVTVVKRGGSGQGTWMHKLLAYEFASWLDAKFKLFVYQVFEKYLNEIIESQKNKLINQQRQLDYFWDKEDQRDLYNRQF